MRKIIYAVYKWPVALKRAFIVDPNRQLRRDPTLKLVNQLFVARLCGSYVFPIDLLLRKGRAAIYIQLLIGVRFIQFFQGEHAPATGVLLDFIVNLVENNKLENDLQLYCVLFRDFMPSDDYLVHRRFALALVGLEEPLVFRCRAPVGVDSDGISYELFAFFIKQTYLDLSSHDFLFTVNLFGSRYRHPSSFFNLNTRQQLPFDPSQVEIPGFLFGIRF